MKKTLALVLAGVMAAGMTTTAFAASLSDNVFVGVNANEDEWDKAYIINSDGEADTELKAGDILEGGDEIAIPILYYTDENENGNVELNEYHWYTSGSDYSKSVNVNEDWDVGSAETDLRYVKYTAGTLASASDYRVYSVVVTIPENNTNHVEDLSGTISVGRTRTLAKDAVWGVSIDVSYAPAGVDIERNFNGGEVDGIVAFEDDCGEIDIEFGEEAMFTVDATGQGRLNLAWNTTFDKEFAAKYDYANIDFLTFEGTPSFNKTGTLYIFADEDAFIYGKGSEGAVDVNAEWDEDMEAWAIRTRTLDAYVISDVELDEQTVTEDKDDTTTDSGKENPDTGR